MIYLTIVCIYLPIITLKEVHLVCPNECRCAENKLECFGVTPTFVPETVTEVFIYKPQHSEEMFDFTGKGWECVTHLSINLRSPLVNKAPALLWVLHEDEFVSLSNLKYLQINCGCLINIRKNAFHGLRKLSILDLNNNILSVREIELGLNGNSTLPCLTELHLSNISVGHSENSNFVIGTHFYEAIKTKPLKVLDLSESQSVLFENSKAIDGAFSNLEKLNLSKAGFATSTFIKLLWDMRVANQSTFENLRILDVSYPLSPLHQAVLIFDTLMFNDIHITFPPNIQEVYAKHFFFTPNRVYGSVNGSMLCLFQNYKDKQVKRCIHGNLGQLTKFVVAENFIGYIEVHVNFIQALGNLSYIDLSKNQLGDALAVDNYGLSLMKSQPYLTVLIISYNNIYYMPEDTFKPCSSLQKLDLSHNALEAVTFSTKYLVSLQELDISHNKIKFLDFASILKMNVLLDLNTTGLKMFLDGNAFTCECESVQFLKWLLDLNGTYMCNLKSEIVEIDFNALKKAEFMCMEYTVITIFLAYGVTVVIVAAAGVYSVVKQQQRMAQEKVRSDAIEMYHRKAAENYKRPPPIFLSFCSQDDDMIVELILPKLNTGLQSILQTDQRTIATGVTDIRLGLPLANEIIRCIEVSSVVIFFVTKAFCKSSWCKYEAQMAHLEHKPIILMFWEEVDTNLLPVELKKFLPQMTCVYWENRKGQQVMKPDWPELCDITVGMMGDAETSL